MVPLHFSHFQSLLLFALIISLAFGTLGRRKPIERAATSGFSPLRPVACSEMSALRVTRKAFPWTEFFTF